MHLDPCRGRIALESLGGQKPHTIVVSCSDSRVPPELVFDQGLGNLFVVRAAGQVLGDAAVGSIEYAIEHLGPKLIVILGHDSCGAVNAALSTPDGQSAGSQGLDTLVNKIKPAVRPWAASWQKDPTLGEPVRANVLSVAMDMMRRSRIVR